MVSINLSDPLTIGAAAVVVIALVLIAYYMLKPASEPEIPTDSNGTPTAPGHFKWDPSVASTHDVSAAVPAGSANGVPLYVAAAPTATGIALGKSDGNSIWYYDGGAKKITLDQGWLLPASAVVGATWSPALTRGVALYSAPTQFICRAKMANGVHPGYYADGMCNVAYGSKLLTSSEFEYLVM